MNSEPTHSTSKRGRVGEGRPTKRTPEVVARIAKAIASGLTDREAGILAGVRHDTMTEWRKDPEFSEAIERATAERLLLRLERIEAGEQGWQGTAWALERLYPARFARPEVMNQIAVVAGGKAPAERVIVLPEGDFQPLVGRAGYRLRENRRFGTPGGEPCLRDRPAAKQPGATDGRIALWVTSMTGWASTSRQRQ